MDHYNYMLTIQQEALKAIYKKDINIGYCLGQGVVYLGDHADRSAFCIPDKVFLLNTNHDNMKMHSSYSEIFNAAHNGRHIEITPEIVQAPSNMQLRKVVNAENAYESWIDSKFLGYFKNCKHVLYGYFSYKQGTLVYAYDFRTMDIMGITVTMKPKR